MIDITDLDIILSTKIQAIGEGFLPVMSFFTRIGEAPLYILVTLLICWCWNYGLGVRLGSLLSFSALINGMLKIMIRAPRPYLVDERIIPRQTGHGLGMPSGHAQVVATFWAYLAGHSRHWILWSIGIVMGLFIGISRVYLGVHSFGQVLVGWLIGVAFVIIFITLERRYADLFLRQRMPIQITAVLGAACLPVMLVMLFSGELSGSAAEQFPGLLMFSGMFSGFAIGTLVCRRYGRFQARACWWKQGIKVSIAVLTVMAYGPAIGPFMENTEQAGLSGAGFFLINGLLGLWVT